MFQAADWFVVVGTVSIAHSSMGKRHGAQLIHYHPQFNKNNNDYDVGLLRTFTDMDMTGNKEIAPSTGGFETSLKTIKYTADVSYDILFYELALN